MKNSAYADVNLFGKRTHTVKRGTETVKWWQGARCRSRHREDQVNVLSGQKHDMTVHKSLVNVSKSPIQTAFIKK